MDLSAIKELATEKFVWSIKNFSQIPMRAGFSFRSLIIHKRHARKVWRFYLHPSSNSDPNFMAAYFKKDKIMFDPIMYNCSISFGGSDRKPVKSFEFQSMDLEMNCIGGDKCIRRHFIENRLKGSLTIQCEVTEVSPKSYYPSMFADFENLSSDLTELYEYPVFYDLKVRLQQHDFHLHTCVLYARCPNLSLLLGYEIFKEMPRFIEKDDISPYLFRQLILYLYSGKLEYVDCSSELFMCADKINLQSLKQQLYEKVQEYRTSTEIATQTLTISWDLNEIQFRNEREVPFVQMFQVGCCMTHLAARIGICKHCDGEEYIDVSFQVFLDTLYKPVSLSCVMTLFYNGRVSAYKKDSCSIEEGEEWHFPPFVKLSDIPEMKEKDAYSPDMRLTAEISLSDGCPAYNNIHTKTKLFTYSTNAVYSERLGFDIGGLLSSNGEMCYQRHDICLKSVDNYYIYAHKAILWARWPAIGDLILNYSEFYPYLAINLFSEQIQLLLDYIYFDSIRGLNYTSALKLLLANTKMDCPPYLVKKCFSFILGQFM